MRAEGICLYCGHVGMIKKGQIFLSVLCCSPGCFSELFLHLFLWSCEVVCCCAQQAVERDFWDSNIFLCVLRICALIVFTHLLLFIFF